MAIPRLKEVYLKKVVPALMEKFQYKSIMQVPRITKISINKGIGAAVADKKLVDVGFSSLPANTPMARYIKLLKIPSELTIQGLRPMAKKDCK